MLCSQWFHGVVVNTPASEAENSLCFDSQKNHIYGVSSLLEQI